MLKNSFYNYLICKSYKAVGAYTESTTAHLSGYLLYICCHNFGLICGNWRDSSITLEFLVCAKALLAHFLPLHKLLQSSCASKPRVVSPFSQEIHLAEYLNRASRYLVLTRYGHLLTAICRVFHSCGNPKCVIYRAINRIHVTAPTENPFFRGSAIYPFPYISYRVMQAIPLKQ